MILHHLFTPIMRNTKFITSQPLTEKQEQVVELGCEP